MQKEDECLESFIFSRKRDLARSYFQCFFYFFVTFWKLGNFRKLTSHSFQNKRQIITPGGVNKLKYKNLYPDKR